MWYYLLSHLTWVDKYTLKIHFFSFSKKNKAGLGNITLTLTLRESAPDKRGFQLLDSEKGWRSTNGVGLTWSRFQFITLNSSQLFLFGFLLSSLTFSSRLSCKGKATLSFLLRIYYTIIRLFRFLQRSYIQVKTHPTITNSPFQFLFVNFFSF